jgi:uncharacterized protein YggE
MAALRMTLAALVLGAAAGVQASPLPDYPSVSTSGKAQLWLKPDLAELQFEIGAQHPTAEASAAELEALAASVFQLLTEHGVASEDIASFEVSKKTVELSHPTVDGATQMVAVNRHFTVQVRDLTQWPAMMAKLMALEHLDGIGASFERSDAEDINSQLMTAAAKDAMGNATKLATAFGRKLGPAVAIARGPLDKLAAPFIEQHGNSDATPRVAAGPGYAVPLSIPFAQAVNAIFKLK